MKKFFATALLAVTIVTNVLPTGMGFVFNNTATAFAASGIEAQKPVVSLTKRTSGTATINISTINGANGYKVYRATEGGSFKYVGYTKGNQYTDKTVRYNKAYIYKVRAFVDKNGNRVHSKYSDTIKVYATLNKASGVTANYNSKDRVKITWNKVDNATKYKIYRSTSQNGSYKYIGITTNQSFEDTNISKGSSYYYMVRSYRNMGGAKYNGVYSEKVGVWVPKDTPVASTPKETPVATTPKSDDFATQYANEVLRLVNIERSKQGLSQITISKQLVSPANTRAVEIKKQFSHTRPDGREWSTVLNDYNVSVNYGGENLAYGYNTAESVMEGWMNSPGHRANILNKNFNQIGIGVYVDASGVVYATQLFSN